MPVTEEVNNISFFIDFLHRIEPSMSYFTQSGASYSWEENTAVKTNRGRLPPAAAGRSLFADCRVWNGSFPSGWPTGAAGGAGPAVCEAQRGLGGAPCRRAEPLLAAVPQRPVQPHLPLRTRVAAVAQPGHLARLSETKHSHHGNCSFCWERSKVCTAVDLFESDFISTGSFAIPLQIHKTSSMWNLTSFPPEVPALGVPKWQRRFGPAGAARTVRLYTSAIDYKGETCRILPSFLVQLGWKDHPCGWHCTVSSVAPLGVW